MDWLDCGGLQFTLDCYLIMEGISWTHAIELRPPLMDHRCLGCRSPFLDSSDLVMEIGVNCRCTKEIGGSSCSCRNSDKQAGLVPGTGCQLIQAGMRRFGR